MPSSHPQTGTILSPQRTRQKPLIPVFLVVVFLYWVGLYLYVPTLPLYLQTRTSDLALVGTVLSMYGLWQLVVRLPVGISVDWVGRRKPFILVGLVVLAAGDLVLGSAPDIGTAMLGRALIGVAAACWVPLVVLFSGLFQPHEAVRATAMVAMAGCIGRIVATALNGWLNQLGGYPLAFQAAAGAALGAAAIIAIFPDPSTPPKNPSLGTVWSLATRRSVLLPSLIQMLVHLADFAATFTFIPIVARQQGASDLVVSALLSLNLVIGLLGNSVSSRLSHRMGPHWTSAAGIILIAFGVGGAAIAPSLGFLFFFQLCIGLGFGLIYPLCMGLSIHRVQENERNTAMGLHQSFYSVGMFTGPWLSGRLASWIGIPAMFGVIAALVLVPGITWSLALRKR